MTPYIKLLNIAGFCVNDGSTGADAVMVKSLISSSLKEGLSGPRARSDET